MPVTQPGDPSRESSEAATHRSSSVQPDALFHTLQHERRRLVVRCLQDHDGPIDVPTLVDRVTAWEQETTVDELPEETRQRVYVDLFQSQLPKLDEQGFVDYDRSRGTVEATPQLRTAVAHLPTDDPSRPISVDDVPGDATDATDRSWLGYYAVASLVSAGLLGLAAFGPLVSVAVSFEVVAAVVVALHAVLATGLFVDRWS